MRKFAIAIVIAVLPMFALLTSVLPMSAHAQVGLGNSGSKYDGPPTARSDKERKSDEAIDKAYQDQLKNPQFSKPTDTKSSDPWGAIRPTSSAKP